jgi:hypothetical protein
LNIKWFFCGWPVLYFDFEFGIRLQNCPNKPRLKFQNSNNLKCIYVHQKTPKKNSFWILNVIKFIVFIILWNHEFFLFFIFNDNCNTNFVENFMLNAFPWVKWEMIGTWEKIQQIKWNHKCFPTPLNKHLNFHLTAKKWNWKSKKRQ